MADSPAPAKESRNTSEVPQQPESDSVKELEDRIEECSVKESHTESNIQVPADTEMTVDIKPDNVVVEATTTATEPNKGCGDENDKPDVDAETTNKPEGKTDNAVDDGEFPPEDPSEKADTKIEEVSALGEKQVVENKEDSSPSTDEEEESVAGDDEANAEEAKAEDEDDKEEESLDADEIRTNPAYIPKTGQFYMHDTRSGKEDESAVEDEDPSIKRQSRADGKWAHDLFDEKRQQPKTSREISGKYGFNTRQNENEQVAAPVQRGGGGRRREFGDRNQAFRPNRQQREDIDQRPRGGTAFRGAPRGRTFKRTVVSSSYTRDNFQTRGNQRAPITRNTFNNEDEFPTLDAARALPKRETRAPRRTDDQANNERRPNQSRQGPRKFDGHRQSGPNSRSGPANMNISANGQQSTNVAPSASMQQTDSQQNSRLRQPTDAVYFDPQPPTRTLPPRERRRLQFTAPSN